MLGYLVSDAMSSPAGLFSSHSAARVASVLQRLRISSKCQSPAAGEFFPWHISLAAGNKTGAPQGAKMHMGNICP